MATGTLEVILLQGKDLKDVEKLGKQSPYCIFVCGDIRTRSQACKDGGRNPVWKEAFAFEITNQVELGILVMSEHRNSKDSTIGASHIPLTEVEGKGWVDVTTPVTVNKSGKSQGALMLQMRYRLNYGDQLSESGDSGGRMLSPYRQRSARPGPTSPPTNAIGRGYTSDYRDLSTSTSGTLTRRRGGMDYIDGGRSPEALIHRNHHENVHELPSASSSNNSGMNLDDSAASALHADYDPRYGDTRYQTLTPVDPKMDNILRSSDNMLRSNDLVLRSNDNMLRSSDSKLSDTLAKSRTLDRQASRGESMMSGFELESLRRQLTEMTQQKAALEASLAAKEEESSALKNKISTISSMSFKDRKNWIEEKEHLQLELLTLRQQLGENTDSAVMKQQHDDMVRLRTRVTELEAELTQQRSFLEQRSRMTSEVMLKEQQGSVQEAMQQVDDLSHSVDELYETHAKLVAELEQHIDDTTAELASSLSELSREKAELQRMVQQAAAAPRGVDQEEMDRSLMSLRETHAKELAEMHDHQQELLQEKMELEKLAEEIAVMKKTHVFLPQDEHLDLLAFKSRCAHLEQSSEGKVIELSKLVQEAEQHLAGVEKERDSLQTSLNTTQVECQKLQEAAAGHKSRAVELELQVTELEAKLKEHTEDVSAKERELSELRAQVAKGDEERLEAEESLRELREAMAAKERDLAELAGKLDRTLQDKVEAQECLTTREREFTQESDRFNRLMKEKAAVEVLLKELTASSAAKESEMRDVYDKLENALRERFEFEVEVAELKEKLEEAKAQAEAGMASLQEKLDDSSKRLEEQVGELSRQKDLVTAEQQRAEKAEKLMHQAQEASEKVEKDAVKARDENAEAQVKIMVLDSEIKTMRDSIESLQHSRDEAENKYQELKQKNGAQLEQLQDKIEEQEAQLLSMARERDAATKSLKSLQEHVQGQAGKADEILMKELLEKNFELEMASEDLRHENDVLTQDLVSTKLELARLREVETLFRREVYKAKVNGNRSMVA